MRHQRRPQSGGRGSDWRRFGQSVLLEVDARQADSRQVGIPFADIGLAYILAACAGFAVIAGPSFVLGITGRHKTALRGILIPGTIVFVGLASYLGHSLAQTGLLVALAAASAALIGWVLGAALWQWRRWRGTQKSHEAS
jgi:hypothetical protein